MASVHPEISIQDSTNVFQKEPTPPKLYYFVSQSGKVTEIQATSEEKAQELYATAILPIYWLPLNDNFLCYRYCSSGSCKGKYCKYYGDHYLYRPYYNDLKIKDHLIFLHKLLSHYPDFADGRYDKMYREEPTVEEGDYESYVKTPDGSTKYYNPKSFTYIWKNANVRMKTFCKPSALGPPPFLKAMNVITGTNDLRHICHAWLQENIRRLIPHQKDMLKGSFTPLTERPIETPEANVESLVQQNETRKPSRVLRRRHSNRSYLPIEISSE
jgi:hypothetical protein